MTYDYHILISVAASVIGVASLLPYFRDIFWGKTRPHVLTWFLWGTLTGIAFFAQLMAGGGVGAWATGIESVACFTISILALSHGDRDIRVFDWAAFIAAFAGIFLWYATKDALSAVVIATVIDIAAYAPTFRKAYGKPEEETVSAFSFSAVRWMLVLVALESFNLTTALYPISVAFTDILFVSMLLIRRQQPKV